MENKTLATNRKAIRDYQILEPYEAGIALKGSEVKSMRQSNSNLQDSFCRIVEGEVLLYNMYIARYDKASSFSPDTKRPRRLLLRRKEINRLQGRMSQGGLALIPLEAYLNAKGLVKLKIGIAKKLKGPDKREKIRKREIERELRKATKRRTEGWQSG